MKPYPTYKPTGLKWLPEVPRGWDVLHIRELFTERRVKVSDKDYPPLSVSRGGIVPQIETVAKSDDGDNRKLVKRGDFVINSRSDRKSSSGVSQLDGSVSLINIVLQPRDQLAGSYAHYLLKCHDFVEEFYCNGRGIVGDLWTTRYSEMKSIFLPIPTLEEQANISAYLDAKTAKFDRLIKLKEREIELLQEKKQVVISRVVTRGLDPNVKLVDSGVAWLGKTPQGWKVVRFKYIAKICSNLVDPSRYLEKRQIAPECIEKNSGRLIENRTVKDAGVISWNHLFRKGQIIYSKIRPLLNKVVIAPCDGLCSADMYPIETTHETRWLQAFMLSNTFVSEVKECCDRVKMPKINQEDLGKLFVVVPPLEEQRKIVAYLDVETTKTDKAIAAVTRQIALLKEYRTRLISDAVTGRIDLREAVA